MTQFYVIGGGEFPLDMLRYDRCWPATSQDAATVSAEVPRRRVVCLQTNEARITVRRWESFGWRVSADGIDPLPRSTALSLTGAISAEMLTALADPTRA